MNEDDYKSKIYYVRGQSIMLDSDLAKCYVTDTKIFNKAMKRKIDDFDGLVFQLTKEELNEILLINKQKRSSQHLPYAYTEKGAYKMAFILSNKTSLKVADLILDVFISVREGKFLPKTTDNKILQLEHRISQLEIQMQGRTIQNNFHAPVTVIQGQNNNVSLGVKEEVLLSLIEIMKNAEVVSNQKLMTLLSQSIELANKKDKKGLLENLKTISDIGTGIAAISGNIPALIKSIGNLF